MPEDAVPEDAPELPAPEPALAPADALPDVPPSPATPNVLPPHDMTERDAKAAHPSVHAMNRGLMPITLPNRAPCAKPPSAVTSSSHSPQVEHHLAHRLVRLNEPVSLRSILELESSIDDGA